MGCRLTRNKVKARDLSHLRHPEVLHFLDEYGQPITVQVEGRRGRSHRSKRQSRYATECSTQTDRHWEALRAMGLVEGAPAQGESYDPGPYCSHMAVSSDLYPANNHMMVSPDLYPANGYLPSVSPDLHPANSYLPSVSYSLDHLDRLDYQVPEMLPYQPNSESCLIGCCNTEEEGLNSFPREAAYGPPWQSNRPLGYLPLSELDSGLGCGTDSSQHLMALSEAETDAVSSLPGHTPSSPGSSPSSESLISSEPSDSGFYSVSTGEFRRFCSRKIHEHHAHRHAPPQPGHSPREQRGRWDLESIPETALMNPPDHPQPHSIVGSNTITTVQFHRAERSPTLPRYRPPPSPNLGCRTEPCQRRALWLEQQQGGGVTIEAPGRSQTMADLSDGRRGRRASHPNVNQPSSQTNNQASNTLGPRSRASYPSNSPLTTRLHYTLTGIQTNTQGSERTMPGSNNQGREERGREERRGGGGERSREDSLFSKSPGSGSNGASDWRGFQTLGNRTGNPRGSSGLLYSTLAAPPHSPHSHRSPPSPRSKSSNQKSIRAQLLRARASRLASERSEVTTDEEVRGGEEGEGEGEGQWAGRYWSRTERRRHLELSRQHRERRGGGEEQAVGGQGSSQTVLELSHRKLNRLWNSKLLDDWTTVEELLTHGTRVETENKLCPSPLLSVTTV